MVAMMIRAVALMLSFTVGAVVPVAAQQPAPTEAEVRAAEAELAAAEAEVRAAEAEARAEAAEAETAAVAAEAAAVVEDAQELILSNPATAPPAVGQIGRVPRPPVAVGAGFRSRSMGRTLTGIGLMAGGALLLSDNYKGFCDPRGVLKHEVVLRTVIDIKFSTSSG